MHNSQGNLPVDPRAPAGNLYLLTKSTPSDTCLTCHSFYGQCSSDGQSLSPGGDFYWTKTDTTRNSFEGAGTVKGQEHGHNLNAPGYGLEPDQTLLSAPGGTYTASALGCESCHDPHGNGNFRMLYGIGRTAKDYPGGYTFKNPAPIAAGLDSRTGLQDPGAERNDQHTAYISGMSEWCANCHEGLHSAYSSASQHPVDMELGSKISKNYNNYVTSGNMSGSQATAYLPLVPFEDAANTITGTNGPGPTSKVMCLTCHRAHASPYEDATRWDLSQTFLSNSQPSGDPYLLQYADLPLNMKTQRSLCNKCHAFDKPAS